MTSDETGDALMATRERHWESVLRVMQNHGCNWATARYVVDAERRVQRARDVRRG